MANDEGKDKEYLSTDPIGAAHATYTTEPVITPGLEAIVTDSHSSISDYEKRKHGEELQEQKVESEGIPATRAITTATTVSAVTTRSTEAPPLPKKPWYKRLNPFKDSKKPPIPKERIISREYRAGFFSLLTFQWMAPLMELGYQRPLEVNDIWLVNPNRRAEPLSQKLQVSFDKRVSKGDKYPLLFALHETFLFEIWLGGAASLVAAILQVIAPFTLRFLIAFANKAYIAQVRRQAPPHIADGIGLVIAITIMQAIQSLGTNHFIYRGQIVGAQSRGVLTDVIFEKAMRISGRAKAGGRKIEEKAGKVQQSEVQEAEKTKQGFMKSVFTRSSRAKKGQKSTQEGAAGVLGDGHGWGNGRIVNLMSTDTYRVDQACGMMHMMWTSPISILLTLVVLIVNLTYSALAGFSLLVLGVPLLTEVIKGLLKRRKRINKVTDERVSLTQEILHSVRFVKFFGWESAFLDRLESIRRKEIRAIQILLAIRNAINAVSMSLPIFASMLSFITYSLSKHPLDPAPIFSSLALFNSLRMPLSLLPLVISQTTDAWASLGRMQEFLKAEEQEDAFNWDMEAKQALSMDHADFTWERTVTQDNPNAKLTPLKGQQKSKQSNIAKQEQSENDDKDDSSDVTQFEPFKLQDMNFSIGRNELIAVIGSVGSGKSSLLAALAGDMRKTSGSVSMSANRAFCPQYAWIQNASVKENILFGKDYDKRWYEAVISACSLQPDLDVLPHGDLTEIGERGITLSGGQKQRLNIARAIYFNSDIILMDDPLSAVDSHVGRHMFDEAICGLLHNKCRILATHQLHVLNRCDRIIWMQEGRIEKIDTFENLMSENEGFRKLMASTAQEEERDEEAEVEGGEIEDEKKAAKKHKVSKKGAALMQQEERAVKAVPWSVYQAYINASGSALFGPFTIFLLIISQGTNIVSSLWLSWWTSNKFGYSTGLYIGIYALFGVLQALMMYAFSVALSVLGTRSSRVLLQNAMYRVLRAPMSFFDTTPLGRITNRFSKDVDIMDNNLTDAMRMYFFTLAMITSGMSLNAPLSFSIISLANIAASFHPDHSLLPLLCHCLSALVRHVPFLSFLLQGICKRDETSRGRSSIRSLRSLRRVSPRHRKHQSLWSRGSIHQGSQRRH